MKLTSTLAGAGKELWGRQDSQPGWQHHYCHLEQTGGKDCNSPFQHLSVYSVTKSCLTFCDPMDCSPPSSSVHGISQARIREWSAISSFRKSSWTRDRTCISCLCLLHWQVDSLPLEPPGKPKIWVKLSNSPFSRQRVFSACGTGSSFLPLICFPYHTMICSFSSWGPKYAHCPSHWLFCTDLIP